MDKKIQGVYSALFTIYDEKLSIKKNSVHQLMRYQRNNGLQGFYVGGNTGECMVLPVKTRIEMLETVMEEKGNCSVIAHIGASTLQDTETLAKHADHCGVDAISSQPPASMPAYKEYEIIEYYRYLSSMTDKPIIAYINMLMQGDVYGVSSHIMEIPNIAGVKMTIPNYYYFERLKTLHPNMILLNGPDESLLSALVMGADGGIGTSYNILPGTVSDIYRYFKQGDMEKSLMAQRKLNTLISAVAGNNMGYWKAFLEIMGYDMGCTIFPASKVDDETRKKFKEVLMDIGEI